MKNFLLAISLVAISFSAGAENVNCIGAYVGRIAINNQIGLSQVVFLSNKNNTSGSYWVNFSGWDVNAKKEALSILLAAKASGHRVDVYTTAADKCSIGLAGQTLSDVNLSTNP